MLVYKPGMRFVVILSILATLVIPTILQAQGDPRGAREIAIMRIEADRIEGAFKAKERKIVSERVQRQQQPVNRDQRKVLRTRLSLVDWASKKMLGYLKPNPGRVQRPPAPQKRVDANLRREVSLQLQSIRDLIRSVRNSL